jgi:hypothetical protein
MRARLALLVLAATLSLPARTVLDAAPMERAQAQLLRAYESGSDAGLLQFLDEWHRQVLPDRETSHDHVTRDVYAVYRELYSPFDLSRIDRRALDASLYSHVRYVIVQKSIAFGIAGFFDDETPVSHEAIVEFRPRLAFENVKVLYLTDTYEKILLEFLGSESVFGGTSIMGTVVATGESARRQEFLNRTIGVLHGHWHGWHLETHPEVGYITFNVERTKATASFRLVYSGGKATLQKQRGLWRLTDSHFTWME